jgi:hypothetical protein
VWLLLIYFNFKIFVLSFSFSGLKNDEPLMASMRCDMDYNLSTFISTLNIKSTKPLDAASYRVLAENIAGKAETSCKLFIESVPNIDETAYVNPDSFRSFGIHS